MTFGSTAYLMVILDESGASRGIRIFSERHPTMRFADTSALIMERSGPTYSEARAALIDDLRMLSPYRDWILRELGEEVAP